MADMSNANLAQQMAVLFQQQIETADALVKTLKDENQALLERNHEQSRQTTQQKENLMAQMASLGMQQEQLMAGANLPYSADGFDRFINTLDTAAAKALRHLRDKLETAIETCHEQNIVNGQIIAVNKQSAEAALAILRGHFLPENISYSAGGRPVFEQGANPITKA